MSDTSDGGSSDSGAGSDSSSSDSSWSSDTSSSDNAWSDTSTSDASGSGTSWSGGEQDTTWGDPFPAERPADLPSELLADAPTDDEPTDDAGWAAESGAGVAPDAAPDAAADARDQAGGGEAAPWVPPDAPPPPAWTTGQVAPASPPSSPGYSPYPSHPPYPATTGGAPPAAYPSAYGGGAPPPTGFPPAPAVQGPYPGGYPSQYGPPGYGAPGYGAPVARRRNNGFAIASLAVGIAGLFFCFVPVLSILAVVFGHLARGRIKRSQGTEGGRGLATAGLVLGYLTLVLAVAFWVFVAVSDEPVPDGDPPTSISEFGTDPVLDDLARDCADEDFAACDRLWLQSERGSGYEDYGATCGGRVAPDPTESEVFHERCTEKFEGDGTPA
ncbi:MAG: DUF4190 domain-containing protein [Acidimicrobiales bacterium]|nr:DUF4190 domain-containing protein [Acidimicrobiales bacterium]